MQKILPAFTIMLLKQLNRAAQAKSMQAKADDLKGALSVRKSKSFETPSIYQYLFFKL